MPCAFIIHYTEPLYRRSVECLSYKFMKKLIIPAILISTLIMTSCKREKPAPVLHEKVEATVPVKLPEVPDFDSVLQQQISDCCDSES